MQVEKIRDDVGCVGIEDEPQCSDNPGTHCPLFLLRLKVCEDECTEEGNPCQDDVPEKKDKGDVAAQKNTGVYKCGTENGAGTQRQNQW